VEYENISVVLSKRGALQHDAPKLQEKSEGGFLLALMLFVFTAIAVLIAFWFSYRKNFKLKAG
jgi:type III secretory pathway lipoprotein EscJ